GDSVRASLRDLVIKRLGRTDIAVIGSGFFRESFADEIKAHQSFSAQFEATCPLIAMNGFVREQSSGRQASGLQVYGIDERFWRFHGRAAPAFSSESDAFISEALATDLGTAAGGAILARVETRAAIPADSLHGRKEDVGRTIRLTVQRILNPEDLGEFSL